MESPGADEIVDRCFAAIRSCDFFVFLRGHRHGTGVPYFDDPTVSSYLEMELFAAALLQKPILILHERGVEPEPHLRDLLLLLKDSLGPAGYVIDDQAGLVREFKKACIGLASGLLPDGPQSLSMVPDGLSHLRTCGSFRQDLREPALTFLGGAIGQVAKRPNLDRASRLLDTVASGQRQHTLGLAPMGHGAALFRLWAAIRELMSEDADGPYQPEAAPLWDKALGLWASRASWFGVHGHNFLGPLAAINQQMELRRRASSIIADIDVREPLGAKASALYSIAGRMGDRHTALYHYNQTLVLANQAIAANPQSSQGLLSIRGQTSMQMARLGRPWRIWDAYCDHQASLNLRTKLSASPASIGEAKTDLGFCMLLMGNTFGGMAQMKEGIALLRSDPSPVGQAFLARGLRKLELGAKLTLNRSLARAVHEERMLVANSIEAIDQTR
ncbi:MAG: hypothetical protein Q8L23_01045 [Caulobacter sp.]|nr:hypothetical protein [Caulobacter sp.]